MHDRHVRLLRSFAITTVIMSLAAGAHIMAGGTLPPPVLLTALGALLLVPVTLFSSQALSLRTVAGLIGVGQAALHNTFASLSVPGRCLPTEQAGHLHHDVVSCTITAAPAAVPVESLPMLGLHVIAVLITSLAVARSDAALATVRAWVAPLLELADDMPLLVPGPRLSAWRPLVICQVSRHTTHHGVRGPPRIPPVAFDA